MKPEHVFELRVVPKADGSFGCALYQLPPVDSLKHTGSAIQVSRIHGWRLGLAQAAIHRVLQSARYKPSDLRLTRKTPFRLSEEQGIRLDLIFHAIQVLSKRERMEEIIVGIMAMSREEVYYWHGKTMLHDGSRSVKGIIALRVLLGGETR